MAYDLATAKQLIQKRGVQPPQGADFDTWAMQWLENALNSGDPEVVKATGGYAAEENEGGIANWENAAPSSEWLGKRVPTPRELRRYARDQGWSEDFQRYDDRQLASWLSSGGWDVNAGTFSGGVQKPTETGGLLAPNRAGGGGSSGYGGGGGGGGMGKGKGTYGGAPAFFYKDFMAPTFQDALSDPGFQAALTTGLQGINQSAAARGLLRTGGTLKDIMSFGTGLGQQQYQNAFDRAAQTYGINLGTAKDIFAPRYGSWQTKYNADLQKYLQREGNIYGLLNPNMPQY